MRDRKKGGAAAQAAALAELNERLEKLEGRLGKLDWLLGEPRDVVEPEEPVTERTKALLERVTRYAPASWDIRLGALGVYEGDRRVDVMTSFSLKEKDVRFFNALLDSGVCRDICISYWLPKEFPRGGPPRLWVELTP